MKIGSDQKHADRHQAPTRESSDVAPLQGQGADAKAIQRRLAN